MNLIILSTGKCPIIRSRTKEKFFHFKLFLLFILSFSGLVTYAQAPGGVSAGLQAWYKADAGTTLSGLRVTGWNDQSGNNFNTTQGAYIGPTLTNAACNYNPGLTFANSGNYLQRAAPGIFASGTTYNNLNFYCVYNTPDNANFKWLTYQGGGTGYTRFSQSMDYSGSTCDMDYTTNNRLSYPTSGRVNVPVIVSYLASTSAISGTSKLLLYLNGGSAISSTSYTAFVGPNNPFEIGNHVFTSGDPAAPFIGNIHEIIVYTGTNSITQKRQIESYLAVKYGDTLNRVGSGGNYLNSSGTSIFSDGGVATFWNNIIGIARDDNSGLSQKQSHQLDDSARIYLSSLQTTNAANTGSFSSNNQFVMLGNNNVSMSNTGSTQYPSGYGILGRMGREWQITNTGFTGTYSIDIKLPASVCSIDPSQLILIAGSNSNLTTANVYTASSGLTFSYSGGVITIGNISTSIIPLNSTRYFTLNMNAASVGGTASSAQTICPGSIPSNLTLSGNTGNVIKWQYSTDNFVSNINDIASSAGTTLTGAQMGALSVNTYYRAVVQNGVCSTANSSAVLITMKPGPTITSVTASPSNICLGSSSNLVVSASGTSSTANTIVNYDFNSGSSYATLSPILSPNITCTVGGTAFSNNSGSGTSTGGSAFSSNATSGNPLYTTTSGSYWTFTLGGSSLPSSSSFAVYFQARRTSGSSSTVTLAFSTNGGTTFTTAGTQTLGSRNTWYEELFTGLTGTDFPTSGLIFKITSNSGNDVYIDNFEVQAVQPNTTYSWTGAPSGTAGLPGSAGSALTTNNNITVNPTDTTIYTVTVANGNGCSQTGNVTVIVNPLSVGGAVNSNTTVCSGSNSGTLNLTGNTGSVVKWQYSTNGGTSWTDIVNTTTSQTYTNLTQATLYRAVVQSGVCSSANSSAATITVNAVSVGGSVNSNATVCSGSNSGTVNLTGQTGNVLKWQYSTNGGTSWTDIVNTTTSQTYTNLTQTTQYRAVVQSGVCSSANSSAATITVNPVSVGGSVNSNATVCSGTNGGTLNLTGQTGTVLKWQYSTNGGTSWTDIVNTTTSQTYTNLTQTTQYRAVVQSGVCSSANSGAATITVNPVSVGGSVNSNATVCSGSNSGTVNLTGQTGSVLKWQYSTDGGTSWTDIVNTTTSQTYTNLTQTTMGRAVVQSGVCAFANSNPVTITVNPMPSATISYSGTPFCSTGGSAPVTQSGTSGGTYSSTPGLTLNVSTGAIDLSSSTPGNYTVTYTIAAGVCAAYSTTTNVLITLPGSWTGSQSTDWNDSRNWLCGQIPTSTIDVMIPTGASHYPIINSGIDAGRNITIQSGGSLTITGGTLQIYGSINNSGTFDASNGTVEMKGAGPQTIDGSKFYNKTIKNLIVSNTGSGLSVASTASDTLKITGTLSFGNGSSTLNTGDNITLVSNSAGTANVGIVGSGNTINGNVTVERYINIGTAAGQHPKSWQFLATPTIGQTVKQSWMENGNTPTGYGTMVSGTGGTAAGFDVYSPAPSLKYYNSASDSWVGVTGTSLSIYNSSGYMVFVRGDRSVTLYNQPANNTTLRTKGTLLTGTLPSIPVTPDKYASIGNPYASPVDFTLITKGAGIDAKFYVWDPYLYGSYGLGGYQTLSSANEWKPVPGGTSAYPSGIPSYIIQSGQAFFVHATSITPFSAPDYQLNFSENNKVGNSSSQNFSRQSGLIPSGSRQFFGVSLYTGDGSGSIIADGNTVAFDRSYSDNIDGNDALKLINGGENFGLKRNGKILAIEARAPVVATDTIFYNMSNLQQKTYQLRFAPKNMESTGLQAYLIDNFLNTSTPVSLVDSSFINISITSNSASYSSNRFEVVFRTLSAMPVTFTSITAVQKNTDIKVDWKVENESGIQMYEVEESGDGTQFIKTATITPQNNGSGNYSWLDENVNAGYHYYRVRSIGKDGKVQYTQIVKVLIGEMGGSISVYPNPILNGNIHLLLINQPAGVYGVRLLNSLGQVIVSKVINYGGGSSSEEINPDSRLSKGIYQLEVTKPDGNVEVIKLIK